MIQRSQITKRSYRAALRRTEPSLLDSLIIPLQTGLTWFNYHRGHPAYVVRWWNRLNLLSMIPYHSFLEPFDVIQPLPYWMLILSSCFVNSDETAFDDWRLLVTVTAQTLIFGIFGLTLQQPHSQMIKRKINSYELFHIPTHFADRFRLSFNSQNPDFSFESTKGYWLGKWKISVLPISQLWWCWWRNPQSKQEQISVARQNVCSIPSSSKFKMTFTPVSL